MLCLSASVTGTRFICGSKGGEMSTPVTVPASIDMRIVRVIVELAEVVA